MDKDINLRITVENDGVRCHEILASKIAGEIVKVLLNEDEWFTVISDKDGVEIILKDVEE